jgi:hypothetical protein
MKHLCAMGFKASSQPPGSLGPDKSSFPPFRSRASLAFLHPDAADHDTVHLTAP